MATVSFAGHIGKVEELRQSNSGVDVLEFTVAENDYRNGAEHTNWFNVIVFNGFAKSLSQRLEKGQLVMVSGNLRIEEFERQDGSKGRAVRVIADRVQTLGKRQQSQSEQAVNRLAPQRSKPTQEPEGFILPDEDLPF